MRLVDVASFEELREHKFSNEADDIIEFLRRIQSVGPSLGYPVGEVLIMFNRGMGLNWTTMDHERESEYVAFLEEFKEDKFRVIDMDWHNKLLAHNRWYAERCSQLDSRRERTKYADFISVAQLQERETKAKQAHQSHHADEGHGGY